MNGLMLRPLAEPMRLSPEFRQGWLDALRSPEWAGKETYVELECGDRVCALGLALKINGVPTYDYGQNGYTQNDDESNPISYTWLKRQGVNVSRCWLIFDGPQDEEGNHVMTFAQFADWLEANSEAVSE
jgi:hypothetical protein